MKKIISLILVLALCVSLCVPAFADGTEAKVKQFSNYVSLGDSIACGYNASNLLSRENMYWVVNDTAYCWQVADAVGCQRENVYAEGASFCGARTVELYMLLGGQAERDAFNGEGSFFGARLENMLTDYADKAQQKIAGADLITLNIGGNDFTNYALHVTGLLDGDGRAITAQVVEELVAEIWKGYNNLCEYYPKLLSRIRELNDDATLLVTGIFNPFYDAALSDDLPIAVTSALSVVTGLINKQIENWVTADDIHGKYINVDDAESYFNSIDGQASTVLGGVSNILLYVHPTAEGYKYIARQMIAALTEEVEKSSRTDVEIDLNGVNPNGVVNVLVDGKTADYTVNGKYSMTVKCNHRFANTVTVTAVNGGKVQVFVWRLTWNAQSGYSAALLTKSGDVVTSVKKVAMVPVNVTTSLVKLLRTK